MSELPSITLRKHEKPFELPWGSASVETGDAIPGYECTGLIMCTISILSRGSPDRSPILDMPRTHVPLSIRRHAAVKYYIAFGSVELVTQPSQYTSH
jgi:hypothetical protein